MGLLDEEEDELEEDPPFRFLDEDELEEDPLFRFLDEEEDMPV